MKIAFIGGGSFQTISVVRSAMAEPKVFDGGEINLYDLNVPRAETIGRLLMRTPEYARIKCTVRWGTTLDKALDGADAVSVVIPVGSPMVTRLSDQTCMRRGFIGGDQLSASGAFRSLTGGQILWNIAKKMEKRCPDAWLACFANPVAVYSGLVNNHTKIKCLGVCGGYQNHMWDLTRLMGRDAFCPDYNVEVAGINHCSFIIRGTLHGKDIYRLLAKHLTPDWRPPRIGAPWSPVMRRHIRYGLLKLAEQFRKFGVVTFSTEGDGMAHLFYEEMFERSREHFRPLTRAQIARRIESWQQARRQHDDSLRALLDSDLGDDFWADHPRKHRGFGRSDNHITVKIIKALAGVGPQKIVTSRPNLGAVAGFKDRTVLEYSQILDRDSIVPYGDLAIPDAYHAVIAPLATHQTLLGDAIATNDPKTLFHALHAYPIHQNTRASRTLWKELLDIHKDEIPAIFQKTKQYL